MKSFVKEIAAAVSLKSCTSLSLEIWLVLYQDLYHFRAVQWAWKQQTWKKQKIQRILLLVLYFHIFYCWRCYTWKLYRLTSSWSTGSWIPRAPMKGFWWHLHVGSSNTFPSCKWYTKVLINDFITAEPNVKDKDWKDNKIKPEICGTKKARDVSYGQTKIQFSWNHYFIHLGRHPRANGKTRKFTSDEWFLKT